MQGFWQALATDLFASKEKKIALHVQEIIEKATSAINICEQDYGESDLRLIAKYYKMVLLKFPRGAAGHDQAYRNYAILHEKNDPLHAGAYLAAQMILADFVVRRGGDAGKESFGLAIFLGVLIDRFLTRHGVEPFGVTYANERDFEDLRQRTETANCNAQQRVG